MTGKELYAHRYRLCECLGRGGVGEVWLARDLELTTEVALKFLNPRFSEVDHEILKRETRQARSLSHRHILPVYDFHHPVGEPAAISMEYAPGGSLADLLSEGRPFLEVDDIAEWILQACDALHHAHNRGIIHRDVNPSNLMLSSENELKVGDFGLAAQLTGQLDPETRKTIGNRGTLHYASPQIVGNPFESHAYNDVYALGVTVFVLLTGVFPFPDPRENRWPWNPHQLLSISERRMETGGGPVPATWEYAVARCLAEDPADRPGDMKELAEMLAGVEPDLMDRELPPQLLREAPVEVEIPDREKSGQKRFISYPLAISVLLVAALLGILLGFAWGAYHLLTTSG